MNNREHLVAAVAASPAQDDWAHRRIAKAALGSESERVLHADDGPEMRQLAEGVLVELRNRMTPMSDAILLALVDAHEAALGPLPPTRGGGLVREEAFHGESLRSERRSAVAWLIEAACRWSTGPRAPTTAVLARLGALARLLQLLLRASDDAWKLGGAKVRITAGRIEAVYVDGCLNSAALQMAAGGGQAAFDYMREGELMLAGKVARGEMEQLDRAVQDDLGWSFGLFRIIKARHDPATYSSARRDRVEHVLERLTQGGATQSAAEAFLGHLTISRTDDFDPAEHAHAPHRQGRPLGYGNRLFLETAEGVVWCPAHTETVATTWLTRGLSNRIRDEGRSIKNAARAVSGSLDAEFNKRVARFLAQHVRGWQFSQNVTSVAGTALASPEGTLGDIDILGLSCRRRAVIAIECKRLSPGLGPYETWIEHRKFNEEKGHIAKHAARRQWLEEHRDLLGPQLKAAPDEVAIHAVIVTSAAVPTSHQPGSAVPIIAWWDLLAWFNDEDAMDNSAFGPGALMRQFAWTDL